MPNLLSLLSFHAIHVAPARITFDYREVPSGCGDLAASAHALCEVLEGQLGVEFVLGQV